MSTPARSAATPLVLVVLAAGTAAYAYLVDRARVSDADREARRADVFPSFREGDVRRVELKHGPETLVLERGAADSSGWVMTAPRREATDPAEVDVLLRELESAARVRDVAASDSKGLDAPRVLGTIAVGPLSYRFELGDDAVAPQGSAYMRVDGEGTFVVGRSLKVQLLRGADAYRERALVEYGMGEVARVEIGSSAAGAPPSSVVLERRGASFRLGASGLRASRAGVEQLFEALADARAELFLDDAAGDRALVTGASTVVVTPRDPGKAAVRLVLGGPCPSSDPSLAADVVVVRTAPTRETACVPKHLVEAIAVAPDALLDAAPFAAHADEIEELRIQPSAGTGPRVEIARRGSGWHERAPEDRDLGSDETDSANALVAALAGARAVDVRRAEPGERIMPRERVAVVRAGGESTEVVEVGPPDATGAVLVHRVEDDAVLHLTRAAAQRFEPHPIALEARGVWPVPFDPGAVVAVDDTCTRAPEHLELDAGVWKARGFDADSGSAIELADAFARARAGAWVAEADDGTFGFGRDGACAVVLSLSTGVDGGLARVRLEFGAPAEDGVYARVPDRPGIFLAPAALRALAGRPVVDRDRVRVDVRSLARVVLAHDGATLVLARPSGGDRLERADAGSDGALEAALGGLHAEFALHTGPADRSEGLDHPTLAIDADHDARITIGAATRDGATEGYFARVSGVDATFLVPREPVDAILAAW